MPKGPVSMDGVGRGHEHAQDAVAGQGGSAPGAGGLQGPAMLPAPQGELEVGILLTDPQCNRVQIEWHLGLRHCKGQSWWRECCERGHSTHYPSR